jgi:hypothetical protein
MTTIIRTLKIRAKVESNYFYIRNMEAKGGVIDGMLNPKISEKVSKLLLSVTTENFSDVWDKINLIKGVKAEFSNN